MSGLFGGVEEFVFGPERHDDERVDARAEGSGEEDDGVAEIDVAMGEGDDAGEFDLPHAFEFDVGDLDDRVGGESFGEFAVLAGADDEDGSRGEGVEFGEGIGRDDWWRERSRRWPAWRLIRAAAERLEWGRPWRDRLRRAIWNRLFGCVG